MHQSLILVLSRPTVVGDRLQNMFTSTRVDIFYIVLMIVAVKVKESDNKYNEQFVGFLNITKPLFTSLVDCKNVEDIFIF